MVTMNPENTYEIKNCACQHCSFEGDVTIFKGVKLEDAICENCGNQGGLYRKPTSVSYYDIDYR